MFGRTARALFLTWLFAAASFAEGAGELRARGERLISTREYAAAVAVLERAVALEGSAAGHALLGRALALERRFGEGVEHLRRALALGDVRIGTRLYLGAALWEAGEVEEAERVFRGALAESGGAVQALHQLARLLIWRGRHGEALPLLEQAAALSPDAPELQQDLARAYQENGRSAEAIAVYRRLVAGNPELAKARYALGLLLQRTGDAEGARRELGEYARLHAEDRARAQREGLERARLDEGWRLLADKGPRAALEHFQKISGWEALSGQAAALTALGRHAEAVQALERAALLAPEREELRLALAEARQAAEKPSGK